MPGETSEVLTKARIRRWRAVHSGWLVVEPSRLVVYRVNLLGGRKEAAAFDTACLKGTEYGTAKNELSLRFEGTEGEASSESVSFASAAAAESVHAVLSGILKAAEEERRRCEEEAATRAREHEEYIRKARLEFASDVWRNAEAIWLLVKAHYKMCHSVIEGEWPDARQQYSMLWQQADRLKESIKIELAEALKDLDDRICAEDGAEVIKTAGSILGDIGRQTLQTDAFWTRWQKHQEAVSGLSPNWNHIPYFLLFSAGYHDAVLSSKIGDWTGVSDGFSVVRSSIDVIRRCFNIHLNGSFEGSVSAGVSRDARLLNDSVERVEMEMMAAFEKKYFEHNGPVATPSGECNGPLR